MAYEHLYFHHNVAYNVNKCKEYFKNLTLREKETKSEKLDEVRQTTARKDEMPWDVLHTANRNVTISGSILQFLI
jgi:hypothetical protein